MRRALLALVVLAGGCAGQRGPAPQPTAGLDWFFHPDGETGKLAYGTAESDEVLLLLECRKDSDQIELSRPAATGSPARIVISAHGVDAEPLPATAADSLTHEGVVLAAATPIGAPAMEALRRYGWLGVTVGDKVRPYVAQPGGTAVTRFFDWCEG